MNFNDHMEKQRAPEAGTAKEKKETNSHSSEFIKNHYVAEEEEWKKLLNTETLKGFSYSEKEQHLRLKDVLDDVVSEYLSSDDGVTPQDFCIILRNVLKGQYEYFQRQADRNKKVLDLLNYSVDNNVPKDC